MQIMNVKDFLENLPSSVPQEAIQGMETVFHFDIKGDPGLQATITLKDGKVSHQEGLHGEPKCVVSSTKENIDAVLSGQMNPMMAIMTGKIKISNTAEMMKYAKIFGLM